MDNGQNKPDPREERRIIVSQMMDPRTYGITYKLDSPEAIGDALTRLRSGGVNILGPETRIDYIPRFHQASLRWELVDPYAEGNWYPQAGGGLSMYFVALNKLAMIAGITWGLVERDDDGSIPLYWRVRLSASVKMLDGTIITQHGLGEADLRDDSAEVKKALSESKDASKGWPNVIRMRAKGSQRCESIAKAGLIRKMLGIRAKYSKEEAEMPFVWPTLVFAPPPDPELDRAIMFQAAGLGHLLYGGRSGVIDTTATVVQPRALEDRGAPVDFRAEQERLGQRERVPVAASASAAPPATPAPSVPPPAGRFPPRPTPPPAQADDRMPWDDEEPVGDPATLSQRVTWEGLPYTADEIRAFCASRVGKNGVSAPWPDITAENPAAVAKFVEWATSQAGASTLSAYFVTQSK